MQADDTDNLIQILNTHPAIEKTIVSEGKVLVYLKEKLESKRIEIESKITEFQYNLKTIDKLLRKLQKLVYK